MSRRARPAVLVIALASALLRAGTADAHTVGLSNGRYVLEGQTIAAVVSFADRELATLVPEVDADHDGILGEDELAARAPTVASVLVAGIAVTGDGVGCAGRFERAWSLDGENGTGVSVRYTCPRPPRRLGLAWPLLASGRLAPGHRHMATVVVSGHADTAVLDAAHPAWSRDLGGGTSGAAGVFWSMLVMGVEHILTGYDHLVFLLGLIIVGGRVRSLIGVVSAFTLAHSLTLALAALGVIAPSPRIVEPAIALSIAYVGVENLFIKDVGRRWRVTFPFGLVHGFGFAGALRGVGLPAGHVPAALVAFNLGVEIGQLAILALALPLVLAVRRLPAFGDRGVRAVSSTIAIAGAVLFVARVGGR